MFLLLYTYLWALVIPNYVITSQEKVIFLYCFCFLSIYIYTFYSSNRRRTTSVGHIQCKCEWNECRPYTCVYCSKIVFKITIIVVNVDFNMYKRNKDVFLKTWLLFAMQAIMRLMCIKICNSYTHTRTHERVYIFVFLLNICKLYRERETATTTTIAYEYM